MRPTTSFSLKSVINAPATPENILNAISGLETGLKT